MFIIENNIKKRKVFWLIFFCIIFVLFIAFFVERSFLPETDLEMKKIALEYGEQNGKSVPPRPFYFDGCTLFPDSVFGSSFKKACLDHDIAYYYGGEKSDRLKADIIFKKEISGTGLAGRLLSYPMYLGVRLFGDSFIARYFDSNWGFGYN
ncbi:MAG: hypothetical protein ACQESA_02705 [Patescibacteria group bacterium]